MLLLLLFCITTVLSFNTAGLHHNGILESKCDAFPGRSLFHKSSCYLIIETDTMKCSEVIPMFKVAERQLTDASMKQLKFLREKEATFKNRGEVFLNYEEQLCVLSTALHCPPDSELIGSECFFLNENKKTHKEAMADCEYKGMKMFYPHSDEDIKTVIELTDGLNINELWLSAIKHASGVWEVNDNSSIFDYSRWSDTSFVSFSNKLYTTLSVGKKANSSLGYMNVVEKRSSLRLPSICSSSGSTEPIVLRTTPSMSTTTTTTTTKALVCPQGYSAFQGMCYKAVRIIDASEKGSTYYEAAAKCRAVPGGNLATIASKEVHVFIYETAEPVCRVSHSVENTHYVTLMGLRCPNISFVGDKNSCRWDDGTPFGYNAFTNEYPQTGIYCTTLSFTDTRTWWSGKCDITYGCYICQSTGI